MSSGRIERYTAGVAPGFRPAFFVSSSTYRPCKESRTHATTAEPAPFDGALVIDKPKGKTSHDVVDAVRHLAGFRQIGHLGTLDPLATGVLVLLLGRATRLVQFYSGRRKRYSAGFRFGFATDTYDSDGEAQGPDAPPSLDRATLEKLAAERVGRFEQMPPSFSAKKIHGRPAYELARKKQPVELKPVEVEVFEYRLTEIEGSIARFVIECSSGTYIRALAHEMGQKLGCGAHLAEITRLAVGEFSLEQAIKLEELAEARASRKVCRLSDPAGKFAAEFSAGECAAGCRAARASRHEVQCDDLANSAGARGAAAGCDVGTRRRRASAAATARLQSARQTDRHRGSGGSANVSAHRGVRATALVRQAISSGLGSALFRTSPCNITALVRFHR